MTRALRWLAWSLCGLALLLAAAILLLGRVDLAPLAARWATARLGRPVSVAALHVSPGHWVTLRLEGLRLANLPGGSRPEMLALDGLTAEVEALSLLGGAPRLRRLEAEGLRLILEREAGGRKNWKFGEAENATAADATDTGRAGFPTLLDARLRDIAITFRTSGGALLRTELDAVALAAADAAAPVRLTAEGRYNDVPVALEGDLASFDALRDTAAPFPAALRLRAGEETWLRFQGGMTDPLNLDGAEGALSLEAPALDTLLRIAGLEAAEKGAPALRLAGNLLHQGALWRLDGITGALGEAAIAGRRLVLREGADGQADAIEAALDFGHLDLDALLDRRHSGGTAADLTLAVDQAPDTVVRAELTAERLDFGALRATEARLAAALAPGRITVEQLALTYLGGRITTEGVVETGHIQAGTEASGLQIEAVRRALGLGALPLSGRVDGRFAVQARGRTLKAAASTAHASAVIAMRGGQVQRRLLEIASLDLRSLFRAAEGGSPIACLIAVVDLRGGEATVAPLRLRAREGTIAGNGSIDLRRRQMDMIIGSQRDTTGSLALDIPVRVSGSIDDPQIRPARWSAEGRALLAAPDVVNRLLPELRPFARRNPCLTPR
ncbi:AsmA family protein [Teichococcus aerofrigidensis]